MPYRLTALLITLLLLLAACGGTADPSEAPAQATAPQPTATVVAEVPPTATNTPPPTASPVPTEAPAEEPAPTDPPAEEPTEETMTDAPEIDSAAAEEAPPAETVDWLMVEGKTADNLTYLGNPDAPVTMIDYSDFL